MDMCGIEDLMANTVLVQAKNDNACCKKWRKNFVLPDKSVCPETIKKIEAEMQNIMPDWVKNGDPKNISHFEFVQLCEKQPIGKELFTQFCRNSDSKIKNVSALVQAIWEYEITDECDKLESAKCVVNSYLLKDSPNEVFCLSEDLKESCRKLVLADPAPTYDEIKEIVCSAKKISENNSELACDVRTTSVGSLNCQPDVILAHLSEDERRNHFIKTLFEQCKRDSYPFLVEQAYPKYKQSEYYETFVRWKHKEKEPVMEEDFFPLRLLGRGGFGEVYAYQVKSTGKLYACKKTCKKKMKQKHAEKVVMSEKLTLEAVNSPFVVSLAYAYENKNHLNLVMTLMGSGDLKFHIYETTDKKRGLSPERTKFYAAQITLGMDHLHREDILYRDLKPENVLLDDRGNVRIADLGLVCILPEGKKTSGRAGTVGFMAPEMLKSAKYAYGVDWFALGCTIFEMAEGKGPFVSRGKNKRKMSINATIEKTIHEKHSYKRKHGSKLQDLIDQLLAKDVDNRLAGDDRSAEPIKRHPYFCDVNWERLEAGLVPVPFVPDPNQVYAKDVSDIRLGSEAKGINISQEDKDFHKKFASGRVPIPWQQEIMETGLFREVMDRKNDSNNNAKSEKANSGSKSKICVLL